MSEKSLIEALKRTPKKRKPKANKAEVLRSIPSLIKQARATSSPAERDKLERLAVRATSKARRLGATFAEVDRVIEQAERKPIKRVAPKKKPTRKARPARKRTTKKRATKKRATKKAPSRKVTKNSRNRR